MSVRWIGPCLGGLWLWSGAVPEASACSPSPDELPPPYEPCETLHLYSPRAEDFPVGLHTELRISTRSVTEVGPMGPSEDVFEVSEPFVVERETDEGWVEVPYVLEDQPNLVTGARHIALEERRPGRHIVSWSAGTCDEPLSESGSGRFIGEFTMTEDVPMPTTAPTLTSVEWIGTREQTFDRGIDGECNQVIARGVVGETELTVDLGGEWAPWADATSIMVYLDGEVERGFGDIGTAAAAEGLLTMQLTALCSTEDPDELDPAHFAPRSGVHAVQIAVRLGGGEELRSEVLEYEALCPEPMEDEGGDDDGLEPGAIGDGGDGMDDGSGCRIGPERPEAAWLLLGLLVPGLRRRATGRRAR